MVTVSLLLIIFSFILSAAFLVTGIYQEVDAPSHYAAQRKKDMNYTDDERTPALAFCILSSLLQIAYGILVLLHTKQFVIKMRALIFWIWIAVYGVCTIFSLASFSFAHQIELGHKRPTPTDFPYPLRDAFVCLAAAHWMFSIALFLLGFVLKKGNMAEFKMGIPCIKGSEEENADEQDEENEEEPPDATTGDKVKKILSCCQKRKPHACEHLLVCYSIAFGLIFLTVAWMALETSKEYEVVIKRLAGKIKANATKEKWLKSMLSRNAPYLQNFEMSLIPGFLQSLYSVIVFTVQRGWPCGFLFVPVHLVSSGLSGWVFVQYHANHSDENSFESFPYFDDRELAFPSMAIVNTIFCACASLIYILVFISRHLGTVVEKIRKASKDSGGSNKSSAAPSGGKFKSFMGKSKSFLVKVRDRPWHIAVRIGTFLLLGLVVGGVIFLYIFLTLRIERFKEEARVMHNMVRARHIDTPPLVMNRGLTIMARRCAWFYVDAKLLDHSCPWKFGAGENLVGGVSKGHNDTDTERLIILVGATYNMWRNELPRYDQIPLDPKRKSFAEATKGVFHFTQIVWKNSTKFGTDVEIGSKDFVSAYFYHPGGNNPYFKDMNLNVMPLKPEFEMCHDKPIKAKEHVPGTCPGDNMKGFSLNPYFDSVNITIVLENFDQYKRSHGNKTKSSAPAKSDSKSEPNKKSNSPTENKNNKSPSKPK